MCRFGSSMGRFGRKYADLEDYKEFYNSNDYKKLTDKELKTSPKWFERAAWTKTILKKQGTIFDIGCQTGVISLHYANLGWRVVGIDINEKAIRFCNKFLKKFKIKDCEFKVSAYEEFKTAERFDYVIAEEILEHVLNPETLLDYCDAHCRGVVVLTTPNFYGEFGFKNIGSEGDRGEHIRCYKASELMQLILTHGEVVNFEADDLLKVVYKPYTIWKQKLPSSLKLHALQPLAIT